MAVLVSWLVVTIVTIGVTVYEIAKWLYDLIIKPITKLTDILKTINDVITAFVEVIQGKIDYVLDITGITALTELTEGVRKFIKRTEEIAKGNYNKIIQTIADLYLAIGDTASSIIHFTTNALEGVFIAQEKLKADIKYITEFKIANLTRQYGELGEEIKRMNAELIDKIDREIAEEVKILTTGINDRIRIVEGEVGKVRYLTKDIKNFMEMFTKAMEV